MQQQGGLPAGNSGGHVAFKTSDKTVLSLKASFTSISNSNIRVSNPISEDAAFSAAERAFNGLRRLPGSAKPNLSNLTSKSTASHVWSVQVRTDDGEDWRQVFVDAGNGSVLGSLQLAAYTKYNALPSTSVDPRDGFQVVSDPQDNIASPNGWHLIGGQQQLQSQGTNVGSFVRVGAGLGQCTV